MAKRIRARDRRCRFPGCSVAAVFCDLDHVRPWPGGRTTDENLICLCRRHHRIKQRPGWRVTLTPNGVATWTDPTGRVRTTHPVNALHSTVLTNQSAPASVPTGPASTSRARTVVPDGPHTELEFLLEHLGTTPPSTPTPRHPPAPATTWHDDTGRRHRVELSPRHVRVTVVDPPGHWSHHRARLAERSRWDDPPPF